MMPAPLATPPELSRASAAACAAQGKSRDASAEESRSRTQSFAFATTSGARSRAENAASACAIRTPSGRRPGGSGVPVVTRGSPAHLDAGPLLVDARDRREVRVRAEARLRDAEHLEHGGARDH